MQLRLHPTRPQRPRRLPQLPDATHQLITATPAAVLSTAPNPFIKCAQPPERLVERHLVEVGELLDAGDDREQPVRDGVKKLFHQHRAAKRLPRFANRAVIPASLPAYASSASPSAIFMRSSSPCRVARLAVRTRSAPTNLTFRESHISLAVSFIVTCSSTSSSSPPRIIARAVLHVFPFTAALPGATASHRVWASRIAYALIAHTV
ncbi:uncharacterized protein [Aegilops tauschii subsp. strangulata]|uniref:uncharacterized protein n=1 Tax=Aegilops tauschii subsp. strangulata TaxID=200361 RepID=UPI001ABCA611|nr:uncharacterized protein LOC109744583 [Aegilops tauschii subsp. strangulata]